MLGFMGLSFGLGFIGYKFRVWFWAYRGLRCTASDTCEGKDAHGMFNAGMRRYCSDKKESCCS